MKRTAPPGAVWPEPSKILFGGIETRYQASLVTNDRLTLRLSSGRDFVFTAKKVCIVTSVRELLDTNNFSMTSKGGALVKAIKVGEHNGMDVYFEAMEEDTSMRRIFIEECGWTEEAFAAIAHFDWFIAKVTVRRDGVEKGAAYLGGCCYEDASEFYTTYKDDYFKDMVEEAFLSATVTALEGAEA
jgi:hypothetical protein